MRTANRVCSRCNRITQHSKATVEWKWGILLTVFSLGLFIPIWIFLDAASFLLDWKCNECNHKTPN